MVREELPYPIVLYPGHYGAFFGFRKTDDSPITLCSCSISAVENFVNLRSQDASFRNSKSSRQYILDSMYFPFRLVSDLMKRKVPSNEQVLKYLKFEDKLCHQCNIAVPSLRYCHEMYGGLFKQTYGWYINMHSFELGVEALGMRILDEVLPDELKDLIELELNNLMNNPNRNLYKDNMASETCKNMVITDDLHKILQRHIENEVRLKFGHKKIGEAWTSETIVYYLVKKLYPTLTIHRHYRPKFLEGLELDIFIEELQIGIEYQGIQHFEPIKHWGGEKALKKNQERDLRKAELCSQAGVKLIYFYYTEDLTEGIVKTKINSIVRKMGCRDGA